MAKRKPATQDDRVEAVKAKSPDRPTRFTKAEGFRTVYSNSVHIETSPWDFRFRIGQIRDATSEELSIAEEVYVYMSPQHAKAFAEILNHTIAKHEQMHGALPSPSKNIHVEPDTETRH